jgi:hypothetical protein
MHVFPPPLLFSPLKTTEKSNCFPDFACHFDVVLRFMAEASMGKYNFLSFYHEFSRIARLLSAKTPNICTSFPNSGKT